MGATILVMIPLDEGSKLVEELDKSDLAFVAAFWLYDSDDDKWKLLIATPLYDAEGPRAVYGAIRLVLSHLAEPRTLDLTDIRAVSPTDSVVVALKKNGLVRPGDPIKRVKGTRIDSVWIDEAFIYRLV